VDKLVYVLWSRPDGEGDDFVRALRGPVAGALREAGARDLVLHLVDETARAASRARITRLDPPPAGLVSFRLPSAGDRAACEAVLGRATSRLAGYRVEESVPLPNTTRPAPPGERTPGTVMVALLERPERLSREEWIAHWHGPHREVALETQCTFLYVRNVVLEALTPDAPPWEGIVEEGFPSEAVGDPMRWYRAEGSPEKLKENLGRMIESCRAFLDLERVESHPTSEYRLG